MVRFGFVVTYLSEPLVRGYTTGSACHVCISQLKYLFGIFPARFTGPLSLIYVSNKQYFLKILIKLQNTFPRDHTVYVLLLFVRVCVVSATLC